MPTTRCYSCTHPPLSAAQQLIATAPGTDTCPGLSGPCPAVTMPGGCALSLDRKAWVKEIPTVSGGHYCSHYHLPPSWSEMVWLHLAEEMGFDT